GEVRDGLQLEDEVVGLPRCAQQREAGRLALRRGQRRIAQSPASAAGRDEARARLDEVREDLTGAVLDDGALGHGKDEVAAVGAVLEVALADPAVVRAAVR